MRRHLGYFPLVIAILCAPVVWSAAASAEDLYCEVMAVEGSVLLNNADTNDQPVNEGDLLKVDDVITVGADSYVDIAYDRDWNNITRVEENSKIRLRALFPAEVELDEGGVFAKLKSLPKDSTFDVKTPTAIASVRGTEYRTTVKDGETEIYNVSDSDVFVYGLDESGERQAEPVILQNSHKTQIVKRGQAPPQPRKMETRDFQPVQRFREGIERKVGENMAKGRVGRIPDVKQLERMQQEHAENGPMRSGGPDGEGRGGKPKTLSGDEVHRMAEGLRGRGDEQGGAFVSGDGTSERRPDRQSGEAAGRSANEPYFPGSEQKRSGGPDPVGFPDKRWQSGSELVRESPGDFKDNARQMEKNNADQIHSGSEERPHQMQQGRQEPGERANHPGQQKPQNRQSARPQQKRR